MTAVKKHGCQDALNLPEILIISGDPCVHGPVLDGIRSQGIAVSMVRDGNLSSKALFDTEPDLMLLDFSLPDVDGIAVCKQLKACADTKDIPVVLMLAKDDLDQRALGFQAGAVDYLIKPLVLEEVTAKLNFHIRQMAMPLQSAMHNESIEIPSHRNHDDAGCLNEVCTEYPLRDQYFRYLEANLAYEAGAGVSEDGRRGQFVGDLLEWGEDEVAVENALVKFHRCLETGNVLDEAIAPDFQADQHISRSTLPPLFDDSGRIINRIQGISRATTERIRLEAEVQKHLHFFESMDKVNRAIQGSNDLETVLNDALDTVLSIFDCDRAFLIHPCDPESDSWSVPLERTRPDFPGALALGLVMPMDADVAMAFRILLDADGPMTYGPGNLHPLPKDVSEQFGFKSLISMALYLKTDKPWQFGIHQCSGTRVWTADEIKLFQEIGRRLADGLGSLLAYRNLQASEREFRALAENAPFGIARYDVQGRISYFNPPLEKILHITTAEARGKRPTECFPSEIYQDYEQALLKVAANGEQIEFELNYPGDDGLETGMITMVAEHDEAGSINGVLAIGRNVTAQRRAEIALQRSEALYRSMVTAMIEGVIVQSRDGNIVSINPAAERILHLSADKVLGTSSLDGVQQILTRDGKPFPDDQYPASVSLRTGRSQSDVELGLCRDDGEFVSILVNSQPLFLEGEATPYAVVSTFHDITERKRVENTLKFIAQSGWQESREAFQVSVASFMGQMLEVDYVLIGKLTADPAFAETLVICHRGEILPNMRYRLAGTPCDNVMEGSLCCYPDSVQQQFPDDALLKDMGAESYAGLPLRDSAGNTIGLITVMDGKPLPDSKRVVAILQLVAIRVAAELEREKFEKVLAESRQFLHSVIDTIAEPVFVKNRRHRWVLANAAFCKLIGHSQEVLLGKSDYDFFPREEADEVWARDEDVFRTGEENVNEENFTDRNGVIRRIITKKSRYIDDNGEGVLVGIILDITERKQMEATIRRREEEFRTLAENLPDIIVRYDTSCRRTYINKVYSKMLEAVGVDVLGKTPLECWWAIEPDADEFTRKLQLVVDTGNPETTLMQCETRAGNMIYWTMNLVPEFDSYGEVNGVLSCATDITELKEYQREIEKSRSQLRALASRNEMLREDERKHIARELHDDLGQRLTALTLDLSRLTLRFGQNNPELRQQVQEMEVDMGATIQIVRDVATSLRPSALEMGIVSALEWLVQEFRKRTNVSCRLRLPHRKIVLDDSQATVLFRIVQESLTNIMRYAMASEVEIVLSSDDQQYVLEIKDDGVGFNANEKRKAGSFGLIGIEERAVSLGGEICLETAPDQGLKLTVRIPVSLANGEQL